VIVVSNSSPLVARSAIGEAGLLANLYDRVVVPDAVWEEVVEQGSGKPGAAQPAAATWLQRSSVADATLISALQEQLGRGEAEAIALGLELSADLLLMDERLGRRTAQRLGLRVVGVIGVLVEAKRRGQVAAIGPLIERLRDEVGFRVSAALVARVLADEGES